MIRDRRVCAVIPARGGSKGIPRKNLLKIGGVTLVERAIALARSSPRIDRIYVSTDDTETYAIAQKHNCATPALRPAPLATDQARAIDVIRNLVVEGTVQSTDCILLLQPSSPIRTTSDLNNVCNMLEDQWETADCVVSVCRIDEPHPHKAQTVVDGFLQPLFAAQSNVPRQYLPVTYRLNGSYYLGKFAALDAEDTFIPKRSLAYVMPELATINLDGPLDVLLLEAMLEKGMIKLEGTIDPP